MIAVIDYGMGNLRSVSKALEAVGARVKVTSRASCIQKASKIVFPGVGSFADGMKELKRRELIEPIRRAIQEKKPFLGLCLGLQLLFCSSEEAPGVKGFGILPGKVRRLPSRYRNKSLKVPHIGWNQISFTPHGRKSPLFKGVKDKSFVYFVHSYYADTKDARSVSTVTEYGAKFCTSVIKDNVYATQFHPEKSQETGLKILENFCRI